MSVLVSSFGVRVFIMCQLIFGSYYNITTSKTLSLIIRLYCSFVTTLSIARIGFNSKEYSLASIVTFTEALFTSLVSQLYAQKYIFSFISTMNTCDELMGYKNKYSLKIPMGCLADIGLTILVRVVGCIHVMLMCRLVESSYLMTLCLSYALISVDLNSFKITCVFWSLRNRLKMLKKTLTENRIPVNIVGNYETERNLEVVRKCIFNYYHLLDAFDNIYTEMQLTLISILVFIGPKITEIAYFLTKSILPTNKLEPATAFIFIDVCSTFLLILRPSLAAELCVSEVESIRTLLTQQIIKCSDMSLVGELQWALDCVCRRPFNFTLLRTIPVNINLAVTVFALCIAYTILAMQFKHFVVFK